MDLTVGISSGNLQWRMFIKDPPLKALYIGDFTLDSIGDFTQETLEQKRSFDRCRVPTGDSLIWRASLSLERWLSANFTIHNVDST